MRLKLLILACMLSFSSASRADFIGLFIGLDGWDHDPTGDIQYLGDSIDAQDDLGLAGDTEASGWLAIEHPIPLLPNVRLGISQVSNAGDGVVSTTFDFGGETFAVDEQITSVLDLNQTDLTLYYEILDNVVSIDLGLNVKRVDGTAGVTSITTSTTETKDFDVYIPMLYGKFQVDLPLTGLSLGLAGSAISYDSNTLSDFTARVAYETKYKLGVEAGYRRLNVELDDVDDVFADFTVDGPFLGVFLHL